MFIITDRAGSRRVGSGNLAQLQASVTIRGASWHSWEFDIRTGQSWCDPQRLRARKYAVSVEPGARLVEGPYKAETFPVSVEGELRGGGGVRRTSVAIQSARLFGIAEPKREARCMAAP